jgi:hypothetical protein
LKRPRLRPPKPSAQSAQLQSRYFFHLSNGDTYPDTSGTPLSKEEAIAYAIRVAAELAEEGDWDGYSVSLADANGNQIGCFPVARCKA